MAKEDGSPLERASNCRAAGNELLNQGDYADACSKYDEGLLALVGTDQQTATDLRLALHLNASLAQLRRGNLRSATDHASGALSIDSSNEKGLFRRGSALCRLSEHPGHEEEAKLALADFEKVIQLNPENKDALKEVRLLRIQMKKEQQETASSQRETYKNMFKSGKQLYEDVPSGSKLIPVTHAGSFVDASAQRLIEIEEVAFHYVRGEPVLENVSLDLYKGSCFGIFGNNATGKTTLARLLTGKLSPATGQIHHCGSAPSTSRSPVVIPMLAAPLVAVGAIMLGVAGRVSVGYKPADAAMWVVRTMNWMHWSSVAVCAIVTALLLRMFLVSRNVQAAKHSVLHVSSESSDKEEINERQTIEQMIGEKLRGHLSSAERRARVVAMLTASGFQMYNQTTGEPVGDPEEYVRDGLRYGILSGGQKHLMYVLRCMASNPAALICDEVLGGLDATRQPRVLHMLRRMKEDLGTCILYIGTELSQLRIICDGIGFLSGGVISERGSAEDVLEHTKHPDAKEYVSSYRGLPGCHIIGGKLAQNYAELKGDAGLAGNWLPV